MSSISFEIQEIDYQLSLLQIRMSRVNVDSSAFAQCGQKIYTLTQRRELLSAYVEKMIYRVEMAREKAKKQIEYLNGELRKCIDRIVHEYEDKAAELSSIDQAEQLCIKNIADEQIEEFAVSSEIQTIKQYAQKYFNDFKHISSKNNFFHAAACSNLKIYVDAPSDDDIALLANDLLREAKLPTAMKYPLTLTDVDSIIHSKNYYAFYLFLILDTSLNVILTNIPDEFPEYSSFLLIYDSNSKLFIPFSSDRKDGKKICFYSLRYVLQLFEYQDRHCPICLRTSDDFRCFKPSRESEPVICSTCGAFCQTTGCYNAHSRICPRPDQELQGDVYELIENVMEKKQQTFKLIVSKPSERSGRKNSRRFRKKTKKSKQKTC